MTDVLLACQQLDKTYRDGTQQLHVLKGINTEINRGEMVAITGTSGSGKSTLLHILGGLDKPSAGQVLFEGESIADWSANKLADWRNQKLGFVYQFHHLLPEFNALENVSMPLLIQGVSSKEASRRAMALLDIVGLANRADHRPAELSGGERQRVAIARALVNDPALVLADEPTGNLDDATALSIYQLMLELNERLGTAFVIVTHDQALATKLQRTLQLKQGVLQGGGAAAHG